MLVAMCLGLRRSEISGLKWSDFNWANRQVLIQRSVIANREDAVKTKKSKARLPLDPALIAVLEDWRAISEFKADSDWVWASPWVAGAMPYYLNAVQRDHIIPAGKRPSRGPARRCSGARPVALSPPQPRSPNNNWWGGKASGFATMRVSQRTEPPILSMVWRAVGSILACVVVVCSTGLCVSAYGEVGVPAGTVQQAAADALFLQYAPAPPTPGIICLVDSGVDPNPDTTPILAGSHALSPNTNTGDELAALNPPLPGGHPDGHGTYMAMIAAAPANGWGMVGFAPTSVRVFNLKALAAGQTTFSFPEYGSAIQYCQDLTAKMPVSVVNLSLGSGTQPSGGELEALENYVRAANASGPERCRGGR